jgi:diadenosine tetraphosphate (Ap4A) HIT family hydrolase
MANPFLTATNRPLVALCGLRGGYIQLATAREVTDYSALPPELFFAAQAWAAQLEELGARRVYWITLSEVVRHLHIHLYPRWSDDEPRGLALFEQREASPQPPWTANLRDALDAWSVAHAVHLLRPPPA